MKEETIKDFVKRLEKLERNQEEEKREQLKAIAAANKNRIKELEETNKRLKQENEILRITNEIQNKIIDDYKPRYWTGAEIGLRELIN